MTTTTLDADEIRARLSSGERGFVGLRFIDGDLSGLDLSGCDFTGADLSRADLTRAICVNAVFREASLCGAKLVEAELLGADLSGADCQEVRAERAGFGRVRANQASFFHADLSHSTFSEASLVGADLRRVQASATRFKDADLSRADLGGASMVEALLDGTVVSHATFRDANLNRVRFKGLRGADRCDWIGCDVRDADFSASHLVRRIIMDQNYLHEFRNLSPMHGWLYRLWWLTSDCGRSMLRWVVFVGILTIAYGFLYQLVALDYGHHHTALSAWYFSLVTLTTLGYGDIVPISMAAQVLTMTQVIVGYLALGGLLSIFANKMARRAE